MKGNLGLRLTPLLAALLLGACSSGSEVDSGIGGTGFVAQGAITDVNAPQTTKAAVNTITVNGISYDVSGASVTLDDVAGDSSGLGVGMVVTVSGSAGTTIASTVEYDDEVEGPITNLSNPTADTASFTVLGVSVTASRSGTSFATESTGTFGFDDLANDVLVEVSGLRNAGGVLEATRIEKQDGAFNPGTTEVELKGTVSGLDSGAQSFSLGSITVLYGSAQLEDLPGGSLSNGDYVEAKGTLNAAGDTLTASEVEGEDDSVGSSGSELSVEGFVSEFNSLSSFKVGTRQVDASNATFRPASLATSLANGLRVEVQGQLNGEVLIADEVELEGEEVELTAVMPALPSGTTAPATFSLAPRSGVSIVVRVESSTEFQGSLENGGLSGLTANSFLEVEGQLDEGTGQVVASSIKPAQGDRVIVEGPIEAVHFPTNLGTPSVTVMGVTFSISPANTDIEDENEQAISYSDFKSRAQVGMTIKVRDDVDSGSEGDGIADEISFEH